MITFDTIHTAEKTMWQNRKALLAELVALASSHAVDLDYGGLTLPIEAADSAANILRAHGLAVAQSDNGWTAIEIGPTWFHRSAKAHVLWTGAVNAKGTFTIRYGRLVDPSEIAEFVRPGKHHGWSAKTRKTGSGLTVIWSHGANNHVFQIDNRYRRAA